MAEMEEGNGGYREMGRGGGVLKRCRFCGSGEGGGREENGDWITGNWEEERHVSDKGI